jgi:hypothetical protein
MEGQGRNYQHCSKWEKPVQKKRWQKGKRFPRGAGPQIWRWAHVWVGFRQSSSEWCAGNTKEHTWSYSRLWGKFWE